MNITIREFLPEDLPAMTAIWNQVVEEGNAFPQENPMTLKEAGDFFSSQSFTAVAEADGCVEGLYILHPNNVGRCGHLSNASFAVSRNMRGHHLGEQLVCHCLEKAASLGFRVLQFNAVVSGNTGAIRLYEKLGFTRLGTVPGGFRSKDGVYEDIILFYHSLT